MKTLPQHQRSVSKVRIQICESLNYNSDILPDKTVVTYSIACQKHIIFHVT